MWGYYFFFFVTHHHELPDIRLPDGGISIRAWRYWTAYHRAMARVEAEQEVEPPDRVWLVRATDRESRRQVRILERQWKACCESE